MKITREIMIVAHKMTKEIKTEFAEVNYSFQLGLCMSYLAKEGVNKMLAIINGSEKQIAWAEKIRIEQIETMNKEAKYFVERGVRENWDYSAIIIKIEKGTEELKTVAKDAKFWIEHRNIASAYLQRIRNTK